jgi:transketolase
LRVDVVRMTTAAGSGHPTSAMSAADLVAVLADAHLRYDPREPDHPGNDRLILSKGHAAPLLYAMYRAAGLIGADELLTYRRLGSRLEGHPTRRLKWVEAATGSLGQGLPIGAGMALATKRLDRTGARIWVICGDSELAEGSNWEAVEFASSAELDNLTLVVDVNRLGQLGPTRHGWDMTAWARRFDAFGWRTVAIDGHDVAAIDMAYKQVLSWPQPTAILARTVKGRGDPAVEDRQGLHGQPLPDPEATIRALGGPRDLRIRLRGPRGPGARRRAAASSPKLPPYRPGDQVATRTAYAETLIALAHADPRVVVLDGEVSTSTYVDRFAKEHPDQFFDMGSAEQLMAGVAVGLQRLGYLVFASTFASFWGRAHDFIRMAVASRASMCLAGAHAGVSMGEDGSSQMGLDDLAMFRAILDSTVIYPSDPNQTAQLVARLAERPGVCYLRLTRRAAPVRYSPDDEFHIGGSRVVRSSDHDELTIIGAGVTLHEAAAAAVQLDDDGIAARVIDLYSVKPVDVATLRTAARATGRVLTVEDHWPQGGLGEAVFRALAEVGEQPVVRSLAVREQLPGSATPDEQLAEAGIDAGHIADAARQLVRHSLR